jgi:hypothetical protein
LFVVASLEFSLVPSEFASNIRHTHTHTHTHTGQPSVTESGVYEGEITAEELYTLSPDVFSNFFIIGHRWL